ncbi:hypothetical protein Tco_0572355 [Tanacetum coccineum]
MKDHNDSLIAQVNSKTVKNSDLKAQIQEKVFANTALKNELRKLNGTSVDNKFAKPSILGKPVLTTYRNNQLLAPKRFKSERPNFSKPRFASQVDVINVLSKPVTPHYLPKVREYVLAKPHHVITLGSFRNSQEEYYGLNDMAYNHYLEEARKKTQERNRNSKPSVMPSVRLQNTANGSTPNPKRTSQTSRSLPTSKSSCVTITVVPKADHSRNSSSFLDSKHFFCSACHKCVFNENHDACITKLLNEVNSRKVKPHKTKNSNNPVEQKSHTQKPGRQISLGHRFSPKKTTDVYEKTSPRSCLRWIPTGRIFKLAGLRWIPTGMMFIDSTTKVDSEPLNGSNEDITNPYECDQTLNVSAGPAPQRKERCTLQCALSLEEEKSSYLRAVLSTTSISSHARLVKKWINMCVCNSIVLWLSDNSSQFRKTNQQAPTPPDSRSSLTPSRPPPPNPLVLTTMFYDLLSGTPLPDPPLYGITVFLNFGILIPEPYLVMKKRFTRGLNFPSNVLHHLNHSIDTLTLS